MASNVALLILTVSLATFQFCQPADAQALPRTVAMLLRPDLYGKSEVLRDDKDTFIMQFRHNEHRTIFEYQTIDNADCIVSEFSPSGDGLTRTFFLNRVIISEIKKDSASTRTTDIPIFKKPDYRWVLPGNHGDELVCVTSKRFSDGSRPTCRTGEIEFERWSLSNSADPDQPARVDRALVHLYANLCKGTHRKTPF